MQRLNDRLGFSVLRNDPVLWCRYHWSGWKLRWVRRRNPNLLLVSDIWADEHIDKLNARLGATPLPDECRLALRQVMRGEEPDDVRAFLRVTAEEESVTQ